MFLFAVVFLVVLAVFCLFFNYKNSVLWFGTFNTYFSHMIGSVASYAIRIRLLVVIIKALLKHIE